MKLAVFCTFLLICSRASSGFDVTCSHGCAICGKFEIIEVCSIKDVVVPKERDRLEFNFDDGTASTTYVLHIYSKDDDPGFDSIPTEVFEIMPNLEIFTITTGLKSVLPTDWQNATNLRVLSLKDIQAELYANTFNGLNKLEILYLQWKQLDVGYRIRKDVFVGMNNLTELILRNSVIDAIDDGAFDLPKLKKLDLGNNKLSALSNLTFCMLPNLEALTLRDNKLTHIGQSLYSLPNIRFIDLHNNSIADIDLFEFAKLSRIEFLELGSSGFSFGSNERSETVENTSLKTLVLSENNLSQSSKLRQLNIFKQLSFLDLSENPYNYFLSAREIKTIWPNIIKLLLIGTKMEEGYLSKLDEKLGKKNITLVHYFWARLFESSIDQQRYAFILEH